MFEADYRWIYPLYLQPTLSLRWILRGRTPSPEQFRAVIWEGVFCQYVVEASDQTPIGIVAAYRPNVEAGTCYLAAVCVPEHIGSGTVMEGAALLIDYLFRSSPLRKIYFESIEKNASPFLYGLGDYFDQEARLKEHEWSDGEYVDLFIFALYRYRWQQELRVRLSGTAVVAE